MGGADEEGVWWRFRYISTYHIYHDGRIEKHIAKNPKEEFKNKYKYVYHDEKGNEHEVCVVDIFKVKTWEKGTRDFELAKKEELGIKK